MKLFEIKTQLAPVTKPRFSNDIAAEIGETRYIKREGKIPGSWKPYNLMVVFGGAGDHQAEMMAAHWMDKYSNGDRTITIARHDGFANGEVGFQDILFVYATPESRLWDVVGGHK